VLFLNIDLRLLRYFVAIVDCGSISQASRLVRIAQPALSQHIASMEEDLNVVLLDRTSRGVTPTDAGKRLHASARSILAMATELPEHVRGAVENPKGEVRFGMSGTVSELIGTPLLEAARMRYPDVRLRLVEGMSGHVLDWLQRGDVDVALVYATSDPTGLQFQQVLTEDLCLFGRPGGPVKRKSGTAISLAEVANLELVLPGPAHGLRKLFEEALAKISASVEPIYEVDSYHHIRRLIQSGGGYGILPESAIYEAVQNGIFEFWRIAEPPLQRNIYLTHSTTRPQSSATAAISTLCLGVAADLVRDGVWIATANADGHSPVI
jgi:LysR family nitrogen assimilation transcriptional regulator